MTTAASLPVSVVVPCHDAEATIERALESIANQTRPPAEVIVVDDASTDGTACVLRRCAESPWPFAFAVMTLPRNRGPGEARNAGWAATRPATVYVAFLDADDIWHPRKLERQIEWMEKHPDVAWTAHRCSFPGSQRIWAVGDAAAPVVAAITPRGLLTRNSVATPAVVARKSVRSRFREGWRHCEDLMLWLDWLDEGARGAMLDLPLTSLGRVPGTPGGCTGDLAAMYRGEQRVLGTLATEVRISGLEAAAWRGYTWLRYQRRRFRA